ncbi:hypothetical protein [Gimesia panareensis]|uniref:hypothetical protein n=1 Tax=Gimesia panareensis TaxID=2527978 RepID=UPI00118901F1|nr:hypothetical protein [Gimesia panareensis]QDU49517.1 hypothetical protein Pan110_18550 [Gimesia panareensis]
MTTVATRLAAGGLLPAKTKTDKATTESIVARTYHHPALNGRAVVRLASDRLGEAEDLAMDFLGFETPEVSKPVAVQQRRILSFAAWALINDPDNARYALDLVKQMKKVARRAKSKPGHAWDSYTEIAQELGRSARHFLPPYWEEVGRTYKDLGNQTYAGRALSKSLEAERVHALESDRERRRDVVLEFALSGCLAGKALSEYSSDLQDQYPPKEAFEIFRDLCTRRTRGGMAPWASLAKDFMKMAKAADLNADEELESWLESVVEAPAMGRVSQQFWKSCSKHCERIVARSPAFAIGLLQLTKPADDYYDNDKTDVWLDLLDRWGVLEYLWEEGHQGAPPLGEPVAVWFGRLLREKRPASKRILEMFQKLIPRLRKENVPLSLAEPRRYYCMHIDVDVLEAALANQIPVADPPEGVEIDFQGWLGKEQDHEFRNQDIVCASQDERFHDILLKSLDSALMPHHGQRVYGAYVQTDDQLNFPQAANDRPGVKELWRQHLSGMIDELELSGAASFVDIRLRLISTLWPETLSTFPELASRLTDFNPVEVIQRTLQAGVIDEYGLPALEAAVEQNEIKLQLSSYRHYNCSLTFPDVILHDGTHAWVVRGTGETTQQELHVPKDCAVNSIKLVGDDLAVGYHDKTWSYYFYWTSAPDQPRSVDHTFSYFRDCLAVPCEDGGVFLGDRIIYPGDKKPPVSFLFFHDGTRFWRCNQEYDEVSGEFNWKLYEVDAQTGKKLRDSLPAWFETENRDQVIGYFSQLIPAAAGCAETPLGSQDGMLGWKVVQRGDGSYYGEGIDGRRWDQPLLDGRHGVQAPVGLLKQPGTDSYLPVSAMGETREDVNCLWDPTGSTVIARLQPFATPYAAGQCVLLPMTYWHLFQPRHEASSRKLRKISLKQCQTFFEEAEQDLNQIKAEQLKDRTLKYDDLPMPPMPKLVAAVKKFLPQAPERMVTGVAGVVGEVASHIVGFKNKLDELITSVDQEDPGSEITSEQTIEAASHSWNLPRPGYYSFSKEGTSLTKHLTAVAKFLKGESPAGPLPGSQIIWYQLLEGIRLQSWRAYWRASASQLQEKSSTQVLWFELLKFWSELGLVDLPGQFAVMQGYPAKAPKNQRGQIDVETNAGEAYSIQKGKDLFVVLECERYGQLPYEILRYSTAKTPGKPPGINVENIRELKPDVQSKELKALAETMQEQDELVLPTPGELKSVAEKLGVSAAEIALIWLAGLKMDSYEHNFLPSEIRKKLGLKVTEVSAAALSLKNLNEDLFEKLCESIVTPATAPFAEDRGPAFESLIQTWETSMPRRLPLDADLQKKLSAIAKQSAWHRGSQELLLNLAADPVKHPLLQPQEMQIEYSKGDFYPEMNIVAKKQEAAIDVELLRSTAQLVGLIHNFTPADHEARALMPALMKQVTKLLKSPKTLFLLRALFLHDYGAKKKLPTPEEWLSQNLGKGKKDKKQPILRYDDELVSAAACDSIYRVLIAFHPAALKGPAELNRLQGILNYHVGEDYYSGRHNGLQTVVLLMSPGFRKLEKSILASGSEPEQWLQNPLLTAPDVVAEIQKKYKISEDAAILYAQLLALPDPSTANLRTWNGWTPARVKKAAAELIDKELVLEAKRVRAGRNIFLPGEWTELKTPWLPLETWKTEHLVELDLELSVPFPAGGPLVLRPFEELFTAAWERVKAGDEPRYEEVKRKRSRK